MRWGFDIIVTKRLISVMLEERGKIITTQSEIDVPAPHLSHISQWEPEYRWTTFFSKTDSVTSSVNDDIEMASFSLQHLAPQYQIILRIFTIRSPCQCVCTARM